MILTICIMKDMFLHFISTTGFYFPPLKIKQAPGIQWADIAGLVGSKGHKEITEYPFECRRLFVQIGVIHPVGYFLLLSWL